MTATAHAIFFLAKWGESATYTPSDGDARAIKAVIDRSPAETLPEAPAGMGNAMLVTVANSATSTDDDSYGGISSSELNPGKDEISFPRNLGETATSMVITDILTQDSDMIQLLVR